MTQSSGKRKRGIVVVLILVLVLVCLWGYGKYQDTHLNVLEFRLGGIRLELPCTVDAIEACGYHVNDFTGECDVNEWGMGTLHITQDENGTVYEIYTDEFGCDLEIFGNIDMGYIIREVAATGWSTGAIEDIEKIYGKPTEEDDGTRVYTKYKSETEYAYVIIDNRELFQIGIVAEKPSLSK